EAEAAQDHPGLGFQTVPAQRLEAMLELAVARGKKLGRDRVLLLAEAGQRRLHLTLDLPDVGEARERRAQHGALGIPGHLLGEIAERGLASPYDAARVGLLESGEQPAECRLARAIRADQPDPLTPPELPGQVAEEDAAPVGLRDPFQLNH